MAMVRAAADAKKSALADEVESDAHPTVEGYLEPLEWNILLPIGLTIIFDAFEI